MRSFGGWTAEEIEMWGKMEWDFWRKTITAS